MLPKSLFALLLGTLTACATPGADSPASPLANLSVTGTVDERFLSYNIEMVELTGGRFWRPFGSAGTEQHEYRPPIDLTDRRLRALAGALAPAYVRYSGTWANATWFADSATPPAAAPAGYDTVLTQAQWRGAIQFARSVDARIVTSFAVSPGSRDPGGVWQSATAERWLAFTRANGGAIAAAEFANEPSMMWLTQPPPGYAAVDYRRDYTRFANLLRRVSPDTLLLAPGISEIGEPSRSLMRRNPARHVFEGEELLNETDPRPDAISYHYYGGGSLRCGNLGQSITNALSPAWLDGVDTAITRIEALRDHAAPGAPIWNTESAEAACGGNPWASAYADSFRFVDTLGRSARQGVQIFIHNTLAASDYALIDGATLTPRPNYWAAVLWKRTMGSMVLAPPPSSAPELRIYAHCLPDRRGGVGLALVNIGTAEQSVDIGGRGQIWRLEAPSLDSRAATVNGVMPALTPTGALSGLAGAPVAGSVSVAGQSIAFVAVPGTNNPACR